MKLTPDQIALKLDMLPLSFKRAHLRKAIKYLNLGWTPHQINWHWSLPLEVWERLCSLMGLEQLCKRLKDKPLRTATGSQFSTIAFALRSRGLSTLADELLTCSTGVLQ